MSLTSSDRRDCERCGTRHERLAWTAAQDHTLRGGWVVDLSRSGIQFSASAENAPVHGGRVRLTTRSSPTPRFARVVRICGAGGGMVRLGCRWITGRADGSRVIHRPLGHPSRERALTEYEKTGDLHAL